MASFCQLLEQRYGDELDERARSYIDFAVDGAKRMQALIADLLEFSRLGRSTGSFVDCDLDAIERIERVVAFHVVLKGGRALSAEEKKTVAGLLHDRMTESVLDSVPGLGEHRRKTLVTRFGSVARLKQATLEDLTAVPGIGLATAQAVLDALGAESGGDTREPLADSDGLGDDGKAERATE